MLMETTKAGKTIEKKLKIRIVYSIGLLILGIISLVLGTGKFFPMKISEYSSGFYTGLGGGLLGASLLTIIKNVRILTNQEKLKQREIYENDERNKMIGLKTWSYAGYAMFILLYIGMLIAGFVSELVMNTILTTFGVFGICLFVAGLYCKKTM